MGKVLIIDDDPGFCGIMDIIVTRMGHKTVVAHEAADGLSMARIEAPDVVLLDVDLPDGSGLDLLPQLKSLSSRPEVIIVTGGADSDGAELALKTGAWDYLQKSASTQQVMLPLSRAMDYRASAAEQPAPVALDLGGIVGASPAMKRCHDIVAQAVRTDAAVLITGETGTGKELFARAIHHNSRRKDRHFVPLDCAALPETLVEGVLFGHRRGAFTGAQTDEAGLIAQADGGTLLLDEVGELPLSVQKRFLRVLQEHRYRPIGGRSERTSDFRVIAATNRDLPSMTGTGQFRADLLHRLQGIQLHLPPLRQRAEDIGALTLHHLSRFCHLKQVATKGISPEFLEILQNYRWPGNVRELINAIDAAIGAAGEDPVLLPHHLPVRIRLSAITATLDAPPPTGCEPPQAPPTPALAPLPSAGGMPRFRLYMDLAEKRYFQTLLANGNGDIRKACEMSGLSRSRLYAILKKHGLRKE